MPAFRLEESAGTFFAGRHPRVMGHRGCSLAPENTKAAFALALAHGADILETDVHLTVDEQLICIHDRKVDRTTNGRGHVARMTLSELKALDAGYWYTSDGGSTFPFRGAGMRIPTIEEILEAFPKTPVNIELKQNDPRLVQKLVATVRRYNRLGDVLLAGKSERLARLIRQADPRVLGSHSKNEVLRCFLRAHLCLPCLFRPQARALQVPVRQGLLPVVTPSFIDLAHDLNVEVHAFTVNYEQEMRRLLAIGVDGLFTDNPQLLRKIVDNLPGRAPRQPA